MLFEPHVRFHIFSSILSGRLLGNNCLFSWYKYLSAILVFPTHRFVEWVFLSDCAIS